VADEVVDRLATAAPGCGWATGSIPPPTSGRWSATSSAGGSSATSSAGNGNGDAAGTGRDAVVGGRAVDGPGFFVEPTILAGVERHDRCAQEEIFGPVLVVLPVDDEAEAVAVANCTRYGLAAGVWTSDLARAHRVARQVNAGMVWVNMYGEFDYGTSYGGYAESGFGRELGPYSVDVYTQTKSILVALP
jgi:acyl-CoA reductase-like NAD-dependent aldehyde dehydrogenase